MSLKKLEQWSLTREFLKQHLTKKKKKNKKQNKTKTPLFTKWSLTASGRLREAVARRELTVYRDKNSSNYCILDLNPMAKDVFGNCVSIPLIRRQLIRLSLGSLRLEKYCL